MPEDKAAVYATRLQAGEFIVMVEVPADKTGEIQMLLESSGGEEVHAAEMKLPRACNGRCESLADLSPEIRSHLSQEAQQTFMERYNASFDDSDDRDQAEQAAWQAIHEQYEEDENGVWSKAKVAV
jgi:cation transport regulator ChaB